MHHSRETARAGGEFWIGSLPEFLIYPTDIKSVFSKVFLFWLLIEWSELFIMFFKIVRLAILKNNPNLSDSI